MPKVLKIIAGVALIAVGAFVPGINVALFAGARGLIIGLGASLGSSALRPRARLDARAIARNELVREASPSRKFVFGKCPLPMDAVYMEQWNANEKTGLVIVHAGHLITGYDELYIDGELVTFSGADATGKWAGLLSRAQVLGTTTQAAMTVNAGGPWTASATLRSHAAQAFIFTWHKDDNPRGVPSKMQQIGRGGPVYDPRLDSTVPGGSGSARANDQATWSYTGGGEDIGRNAALIYLTYLLGWKVGGKRRLGVGQPPSTILYDTFIEAANVCETNGWTFDGVLEDPADGDHKPNLRAILDAFAGSPLERAGLHGVRAPHDDTGAVALTVTPAMMRGDIARASPPGYAQRKNVAIGRFVDPARGYEPVDFPRVVLADAVTEDGEELVANIDRLATTSSAVARQLNAVAMRELRQEAIFFGLNQEGAGLRAGDIVLLPLADLGFDNLKVRCDQIALSPANLEVQIEGRIVKASDYDAVTPVSPSGENAVVIGAFDEQQPFLTTIEKKLLVTAAASTIRWGGGQTDILFNANKTSAGAASPGEIQVTAGVFVLPDKTTRTAAAAKQMNTPWEDGISVPLDHVFFVIWGSGAASTRFATLGNDFGDAGALGLFTATFNRLTGEWRAWSNSVGSEAFTPLETDIVVAVGTRTGAGSTGMDTLTRVVAALTGFTGPQSLASNVVKEQQAGGAARAVTIGSASVVLFDGDAFSYVTSWPSPPRLSFSATGVKLKDGWQLVVTFINPTISGFTLSARLKEFGATLTPVSDGPGSNIGGTPKWRIEKSATGEDKDDTYTYHYAVSCLNFESPPGEPQLGRVKVGCYTRTTSGGAWTKRAELQHGNFAGAASQMVVVDGLGVDAAFGIHPESFTVASGDGITDFVSVDYTTSTAAGEETATPAGSTGITVEIDGNQEGA